MQERDEAVVTGALGAVLIGALGAVLIGALGAVLIGAPSVAVIGALGTEAGHGRQVAVVELGAAVLVGHGATMIVAHTAQ